MVGVIVLSVHEESLQATALQPVATAALSNGGTGSNASITTTFRLDAPQPLTAVAIAFIPPEFTVPPDAAVPDGAIVGTVTDPLPTLSLIGASCFNAYPASFTMLEATTNIQLPIPFFGSFYDFDSDGLHEGVSYYPDHLLRMFPGLTPRARLYGDAVLAGDYFAVNVLVFEPGTPVGGLPLHPALGYPTVLVLHNFGDPAAFQEPRPITDVCSPFSVQTTLNGLTADNPSTAVNEGGVLYRANPVAAGTFNFVTFAMSQRDADNDGIENALDTCTLVPNVGDPRVPGGGDADTDGLDAGCDPNDSQQGGSNTDQDGDGYLNRQDNCPQAPNGFALGNQADGDFDQTGDACDPSPAVPNGHRHHLCVVSAVNIGGGGPPSPASPQSLAPCAPLPAGDSDFDGVADSAEATCGGDFLDPVSRPERIDTPGDDDADTQVNEALPPGAASYDCDGDGFSGSAENAITTSDQDPCGANGWPADLIGDNKLNIADFTSFVFPPRPDGSFNYFNHTVPDPNIVGEERWNLDIASGAGLINIADLNALNPAVNAPSSRPPMFGGQPSFFTNLGQCPYPP